MEIKEGLSIGFVKATIVLVPTYITAYLTDKMIYVIPMLAAASFIAASISGDKLERRVEEDGFKKDDASS
jgi:hypothetical protein|tara:strand:- start:469 stop:678 length:210 start_codon:yes stop_codon:yes gene_type:complete